MKNRAMLIMLVCILVWMLPIAAQDDGKKDSPSPQSASLCEPATKTFYIATVHIDGNTSTQGD